jgi:hypothetical protein
MTDPQIVVVISAWRGGGHEVGNEDAEELDWLHSRMAGAWRPPALMMAPSTRHLSVVFLQSHSIRGPGNAHICVRSFKCSIHICTVHMGSGFNTFQNQLLFFPSVPFLLRF